MAIPKQIAPVILQVAIPVPLHRYFDYLAPHHYPVTKLQKGMRLLVPFGKRSVIGFLMAITAVSSWPYSQLKQTMAVLDEAALLPTSVLKLIEWTSDYYHYPPGEVLATALPTLLRQIKKTRSTVMFEPLTLSAPPTATAQLGDRLTMPKRLDRAQQAALTAIEQSINQFQVFLLKGVTGSGKTEVYLQIIAKVLKLGKQALVLVPEIGLTPQILARFQQRFAVPIVVFHSDLSDRQRLDHWLLAKTGQAMIIIGTRSSVFIPLLAPGVIVVDEEHDSSFKQQEGLRYNARDLALVRAQIENIPVILGSATASLESIYNAQQKRYHLLSLPERVGHAIQPRFQLIDLRHQRLVAGLSTTLLQAIKQHLQVGAQVLLFLNRRGFSPIYMCHGCGWMASCDHCDRRLVVHKIPAILQCHYCGRRWAIQTKCPNCNQPQLFRLGHGTQKLEQALQHYFPTVGVARIDRDSTRRKGSFKTLLATIQSNQNRILIGTQMLAKGHHFPDITLVGIINADVGLFSSDFRAPEHSAQLLIQVAGRAGRADKPGEVLIQTHHPQHSLLTQLIEGGYEHFSALALQERQAGAWPPYSYLALMHAEAKTQVSAMNFLETIKQLALSWQPAVVMLGPVASLLAKRAGQYRAQLLFQVIRRYDLHALLKRLVPYLDDLPAARRIRWYLDVDPVEMT